MADQRPVNGVPVEGAATGMGNGGPRVSVVIPFLNGERFLPQAVASVLTQTYRDWELLLVDDGSSDGSTAMAQQYVASDPGRVRYLDQPGHLNRGISAARNLGLLHARGTYLAFLDSDDVWVPSKLEQQIDILESYPEVDFVYGSALVWYSWTGAADDVARDYVPDMRMPLRQVLPAELLLSRLLRRQAHCPPISNTCFRRAAVVGAGLFEEQFRGMHEDQALFAKLCLRSRMFVSDECWHRYRQHPDSCLARATATGERRAARERFLKWLKRYLEEQGKRHGEIWRIVEEQLRPYSLRRGMRARAHETVRRVLPASIRARLRGWLRVIGVTI